MVKFSIGIFIYAGIVLPIEAFRLRIACRSPTSLKLNRVFVEKSEVQKGPQETMIVHFDEKDYRYKHIKTILKLEVNDTIKMGVIDGGSTDRAVVIDPLESSNGISISLGAAEDLVSNSRPSVDLVLAVPRPLRLERILPVVSCMGVGQLVLIGAAKVQQDYFGSHLFRRPEELRKLLIEGLSQASVDCMLPQVAVRKFFKKFLEDVDELFPPADYYRFIAHPPLPSDADQSIPKEESSNNFQSSHRLSQFIGDDSLTSSTTETRRRSKIVVAIGPEGGWDEKEVNALVEKGFMLLSLGDRILRTDMAVPVLLGLANEWIDVHTHHKPHRDTIADRSRSTRAS